MRAFAILCALIAAPLWAEPREVAVTGSPGGLSAIAVTDQGGSFVALSDRGWLLRGRFTRDAVALTGATITEQHQIGGDTEGIEVTPRAIYVSTEGARPRVRRFDPRDLSETAMTVAGLPLMGVNSGLEAIAMAPDGALWVMPEALYQGQVSLWRLDQDRWQLAALLPAEPVMRPVGADFGPDGRLYILERGFLGVGFSGRIRSLRPDGTDLRQHLDFPLGRHGNLEGLSIWRDSAGHLRATMVEDDNQNAFQRGGVVEYVLR